MKPVRTSIEGENTKDAAEGKNRLPGRCCPNLPDSIRDQPSAFSGQQKKSLNWLDLAEHDSELTAES
jgi:hypothetical protein